MSSHKICPLLLFAKLLSRKALALPNMKELYECVLVVLLARIY